MATSVTILPSSPLCSPSSLNPHRYPSLPSYPSAARRPKLQLNTSNIQSFGKNSSLRLDTLSAISPTVRNTFSNAYEGAPASAAPVLYNPLKTQTPSESVGMVKSVEQDEIEREGMDSPSSASTQSSISSEPAISTDRAASAQPYKLNHNIPSILSNSPLKHLRKRKVATSRPMFPAVKTVSFRNPLEEEIINAKYTWAHSDIDESVPSIETSVSPPPESDGSSGSTISIPSDSSSSSTRSPTPGLSDQAVSPTSSTSSNDSLSREPRIGEKRDSSTSDSDNDSCPETPVAGRRKRRREWVWTLGSPR